MFEFNFKRWFEEVGAINPLKMAIKREKTRYKMGYQAAPPEPEDIDLLRKKAVKDALTNYFSKEQGNVYVVMHVPMAGFFLMTDGTLSIASNQRLKQYLDGEFRIVDAFDSSGNRISIANVAQNILQSRQSSSGPISPGRPSAAGDPGR